MTKVLKSDIHGIPTGSHTKERKAHEARCWHHSTHLLAVREGKVLARKRAIDDIRYPNLYTTTVGAHIEPGEDPKASLTRAASKRQVTFEGLSYAGSFSVADGIEHEVCTLWIPTHVTAMAGWEWLDPNWINEHRATPHLLQSVALAVPNRA
jgi:isopentenyldiphosphate isomerase